MGGEAPGAVRAERFAARDNWDYSPCADATSFAARDNWDCSPCADATPQVTRE